MGETLISKVLNIVLTGIYLSVLIGLALVTEANPGVVFLATSPLLLHLITLNLIHGDIQGARTIFWVSPVIYPLLFFMLWNSNSLPLIASISGVELTAFDVVIALIMNLIVVMFYAGKKKKIFTRPAGLSRAAQRMNAGLKHRSFAKHSGKPNTHSESKTVQKVKDSAAKTPETKAHHKESLRNKRRLTEHLQKSAAMAHHIRNAEKLAHRHYQTAKKYQHQNKVYKQYIRDLHAKHREIVDSLHKHHKSHIENLKGQLEKVKTELQINQGNFQITLRSIEDKCKALNFVIGRVYSDKHGASPEIRELLKIDKELYNLFSEISLDFKEHSVSHVYRIIHQLYQKVTLLEQPEKLLFELSPVPKIPIERDPAGNDRIIDVLVRNDKDPVMGYYEGAKEICTKLMRFLYDEYLADHDQK